MPFLLRKIESQLCPTAPHFPTLLRRLAEAQAKAEAEEVRASALLKALTEKGDLTEEARQEAQDEITPEGKTGSAALLQHLIQKGVVSEESLSEAERGPSSAEEPEAEGSADG